MRSSQDVKQAHVAVCGILLLVTGAIGQNRLRQASPLDDAAERERLIDELKSGDAARSEAATQEIHDAVFVRGQEKPGDLGLFINAGLPDVADRICVEGIKHNPANTALVSVFINERVRIFQSKKDYTAALSAAKAYFDVCPLSEQSHAVNLVADCLAAAHPEQPDLPDRFRRQQVAGAFASATTQPNSGGVDQSILTAIPIDTKTFTDSLDDVPLLSFIDAVGKANLLLLCDRPDDARSALEFYSGTLSRKQEGFLRQQIARTIRAKSGCLGPANAYLKQFSDLTPKP